LHAKDLQPDFEDATPISVYVSAGKVPIEALLERHPYDLGRLGHELQPNSPHAAAAAAMSMIRHEVRVARQRLIAHLQQQEKEEQQRQRQTPQARQAKHASERNK